ncbi:MAG: M28 family peptidase [Deltaproteobacteria bacterium]|nr:M28 family peptidase [Deltaproteobacteria bacterium]
MARRVFVLVVLAVVVLVGADLRYHRLPEPQVHPGFDFGVARAQLPALTAFGVPHPVGTVANASVAATLVQALLHAGYDPEVQSGYACGPLGMCGSFRNVIAKKRGRVEGPAVLLLAHHDSTPATSGGHDNGLGAAVVLEIARQLQAAPPFTHEVIFLFDDGEEVGLLGAQAFLDRHPDAARVAAAVNVDGLGGPTTFRFVGPGDGWMAGVAARGVSRPWASSLLSAFGRYSSGFDDSQLFAERSIPNVVLAGIQGYQAYHTPLDRAERVDPAVIGARGRSALELTRTLAQGPVEPGLGRGVYFDVLGTWLFGWPNALAPWVAGVALALVGLLILGGGQTLPPRRVALAFLGLAAALILAVILPTLALHLRTPIAADRSVLVPGSGLALAWSLSFLGVALAALRPIGEGHGAALGLGAGVLGLLTAFTHPGASYLFVAPTLAGGLAGLASLRFSRQYGRSPFRPGPPLLLAVALGASLSALIGAGEGLQAGLFSSVPRAVAMLVLYPVLVLASWTLRRALVLGGAMLAALAFLLTVTATPIDEVVPSSLRLWTIDGDDHRALVFGALPKAYAERAEWRTEAKVFPWSSGSAPGQVASATVAVGPLPVLLDLRNEPAAGGKWIRARACTTRGAEQLLLGFPPEASGIQVRVEGQAAVLPAAAAQWSGGWQTLSLASLVEGCVALELRTPTPQPFVLWLTDLKYGLPAAADRRYGTRPPHYLPQHLGDATMATRRISL